MTMTENSKNDFNFRNQTKDAKKLSLTQKHKLFSETALYCALQAIASCFEGNSNLRNEIRDKQDRFCPWSYKYSTMDYGKGQQKI